MWYYVCDWDCVGFGHMNMRHRNLMTQPELDGLARMFCAKPAGPLQAPVLQLWLVKYHITDMIGKDIWIHMTWVWKSQTKLNHSLFEWSFSTFKKGNSLTGSHCDSHLLKKTWIFDHKLHSRGWFSKFGK